MLLNLDEMRERLRKLDAERETLTALIAAAEACERAITKKRRAFEVPYRGIRGWRTAHAAQVADELIELRGRSVRTLEVLAELQARGSFVPSTNLVNAVVARLSQVPHLRGGAIWAGGPSNCHGRTTASRPTSALVTPPSGRSYRPT